ncbi:MAG TPA: hypothetical protein VLT84_00110, partial [Acidobacteriota bacterium]|nr:hypothetical protein [Acidobacteriota bacterium]
GCLVRLVRRRFIGSALRAVFLSIAATTMASAAAAMPEGYFVDSTQLQEARPSWFDSRGDAYRYSIRRGFSDSISGRLLAIAETVYPPRDVLLRIAWNRSCETGSDTAGVSLWWVEGPGLRRVPYAVTAGAVKHYSGIIDDLHDRTILLPGQPHPFSAEFQYRATIAERDSFVCRGTMFRDVHVAHLALDWSWDDGVFFSLFEARRTVVLSRDGDVLDVDGDGGAHEEVSLSGGIGQGRRVTRFR